MTTAAPTNRVEHALPWSLAVLFLQLTPLLLLAHRAIPAVGKPLASNPRLDAALGEAGRQFLQAAPAPFLAYALSTVGLAPLLLLAGASLQFDRAFPPRPLVRLLASWTALQLLALLAAAILLGARGFAVGTTLGWAFRLSLWSGLLAVPWLVLFGALSLFRQSLRRRVVAAVLATLVLLLFDAAASSTIPVPLLPGAVARALLSAHPAPGLLATCCYLGIGALAWRSRAPSSARMIAAPSAPTELSPEPVSTGKSAS